ncbi:cytochrome c oxidase subunit 8A, mitochondrial precursor [Papio anubis]|uniref:Cytochrome c oxidase subunit 8A, mitochondrial n=5 Tax=Cercopithecinae TaxID=9528 RepID=COX8A_PAPAN|nr:cytochrome c oxidase subunit 8A, mitochondrial precursor [Papio anubis]XP_011848846.1 PREDICTED: cytochrome c oxidase subunit 8A, mitochondrial [Mandrillus leucophaeus]XP_011897343.1 PREDICTED: cytochrome c oxidase subunit 8A, mitochondrial [Cercocebus atys]XP_025213515.1 cytochrome c oxidase subunit 8A, mitochondrial [Theropithecus gelada]Q862Z8.1 RecName: Full=Cytochrome c oxidase subunit 8A, mitochondrial; AltName: Full=Cytochrome c oxidase polypeptide VIII-liver/heart; AltName: Full=Cyto
MSVLTSLLLRGLTGSARRLPVPRAKVHSMPPEEELGTLEKAIALTSCFVSLFLPAGWILSHLEDYKRPE